MRRRLVGLALVLPVGIAALALAGCSQGDERAAGNPVATASVDPRTAESPTAAAATDAPSSSDGARPDVATDEPSAVPSFVPPTSTEVVPAPADGAILELPPVAVGETVDAGGGLTAEVLDIEASEITGGVPGDIAGPAVAVTVEVANGGTAAADIAFVVVSVAYGDGQEAPGFEGGPADPLVGPIPAGEARRGTYVFGVPGQGTGTLKVRVGTDPARPLAVFTADASVWADR